jgi:cytochrome c biogenesis protein ResB
MNTTTERNDQSRGMRKYSFFGEWMLHLALVVIVVGALVERGIALSGGTIV